jgi:hypothetical protein
VSDTEQTSARKADLARRSDELLEAIDDLHRLEELKRNEKISTPAFHRLAEDITAKSRQVFDIAHRQESLGNVTETTDESIEEAESRAAARLLER